VLTFSGGCPVVKVERVAGQFAKPRSADFEDINELSLPSYRGDIINDIDFSLESREPKTKKLLKAYNQSAATMNLLSVFATDEMIDLT
ncbi:3-deoxy-7-phosphoheptulonate synthase, partial [Aliarcobacter butzleri]